MKQKENGVSEKNLFWFIVNRQLKINSTWLEILDVIE